MERFAACFVTFIIVDVESSVWTEEETWWCHFRLWKIVTSSFLTQLFVSALILKHLFISRWRTSSVLYEKISSGSRSPARPQLVTCELTYQHRSLAMENCEITWTVLYIRYAAASSGPYWQASETLLDRCIVTFFIFLVSLHVYLF